MKNVDSQITNDFLSNTDLLLVRLFSKDFFHIEYASDCDILRSMAYGIPMLS